MKFDDLSRAVREKASKGAKRIDDNERLHDEWWLPKSDRAKAAASEAIRLTAQVANARRMRARRGTDLRRFERQVQAYVCDLWRRQRTLAGASIAVSRAKRKLEAVKDRYDHPAMTGAAVVVQDALVASGLCQGLMGYWGGSQGEGRRSTLTATRLLLDLLPDPQDDDFLRDAEEEVIILRAEKEDLTHYGEARERSGKQLDYDDTPDTKKMRGDLRRINEHLAEANVVFDDGALASFTEDRFDPNARRLYRIFSNGRFDTGGRLYRGFWIGLPKASRHDVLLVCPSSRRQHLS